MNADGMKDRLRKAYAKPTERFCHYSANSAETGSATLNAMDGWDWTPVRSHGVPGNGTHVIPLAFGCPLTHTSEGKEWIEKRITDAAQVAEIEIPDPHSGRTGEILASIREMDSTLPPGEMIRMPDMQSPLGVAELMWDESFYLALIEEGEAVHALLDKLTTFITKYTLAIQEAAGARLNPIGFPCVWGEGRGCYIADDTMSLVSPQMHLEFSVPYINRISDACGPLCYHSCTWRAPYFENIKQIRNVATYNWNPGNSDDPATIVPAFSGRAVIAPHLVLEMHRDHDVLAWGRDFADEYDFFAHFLDCMRDDTTLYFWFSNICKKGAIMERIHDLLDERGYTPRSLGLA